METNDFVRSGYARRRFVAELQPGDYWLGADATVKTITPTHFNRFVIVTTHGPKWCLAGDFVVLVRNA